MKSFWLSWYAPESREFELHSPWWISGAELGGANRSTVCAAIQAHSEDAAKAIVLAAQFDAEPEIEFRFVEEMPPGWSPYCDRFPKADWMPAWPPANPS